MESVNRSSAKLVHKAFRLQMGIPSEHPVIPMAGNKGGLRNGETPLDKATYCLVAQVMKMQVHHARPFAKPLPRKLEGVFTDGENAAFSLRHA